MKFLTTAFAFFFFFFSTAFAQEKTATAASSTNIEMLKTSLFSDKIDMTWKDTSPSDLTLKQGEGKITLDGSMSSTFDLKKFVFYFNNMPSPPHTVTSSFNGKLEHKNSWKSEMVTTGTPVSWCSSSLETKLTADHIVGEQETLNVVIAGKQTAVSVFPIYERGYWNRCYSGKFFRKILFSPELQLPLSVEMAMYSVNGRDINTAYSFKVVEIK